MKLSFGAACRRPIQMATTTELGGVGLKLALSADPCVLGECLTQNLHKLLANSGAALPSEGRSPSTGRV
jgi:hypothetical protein